MKPFYSKLLIDEANAPNNLQQLCNSICLEHGTKSNGISESLPPYVKQLGQEILGDYLRNNVGVNCKDRADILDKIFGENGILNATDVYQYETKATHLLT
jgi:hypothetical protein